MFTNMISRVENSLGRLLFRDCFLLWYLHFRGMQLNETLTYLIWQSPGNVVGTSIYSRRVIFRPSGPRVPFGRHATRAAVHPWHKPRAARVCVRAFGIQRRPEIINSDNLGATLTTWHDWSTGRPCYAKTFNVTLKRSFLSM